MPLGPTMKNFLQAILYEKVRFLPFSARIAKFNNVDGFSYWYILRTICNNVIIIQAPYSTTP